MRPSFDERHHTEPAVRPAFAPPSNDVGAAVREPLRTAPAARPTAIPVHERHVRGANSQRFFDNSNLFGSVEPDSRDGAVFCYTNSVVVAASHFID